MTKTRVYGAFSYFYQRVSADVEVFHPQTRGGHFFSAALNSSFRESRSSSVSESA